MLSKRCQRHYSFLEPLKLAETKVQSMSGTLSPDTITTTSSGYSTGGSSVSTTIVPPLSSLKDHNQSKVKPKSIHNLLTKIKNLIVSPKTKLVHSTTSKEMSSIRQYSTTYDLPSSTIATSNTISLPFIYAQNSPIKKIPLNNKKSMDSYVTKTTNYDRISAWLDHTDLMIREEDDLLFIDEIQQQSISSSPTELDYTMLMKKTPMNSSRAPRRSTSMVSTMSRPIIERKTVSPTSSFSSSILARGMSENMTPQKTYHLSRTNLNEEPTNILIPKSNRRRAIDFNRRRTVAGPTEPINTNNKENLPINRRQQIYRFSPSTSTNQLTKKYYFHSNPPPPPPPPVKNEDILMNSYGLTLLQQQQKRQSVSASVIIPENVSIRSPSKQSIRRLQEYTSDSLDDLLCDREVESYFYPNRRQSPLSHSQHIYINFEPPSNHYQPPPYIHGTLC